MTETKELLKQIGMPDLKYLGKGMESIVFELNNNHVLKIYKSDIGYENIIRLKRFYESLDTNKVKFQTPLITDVQRKGVNILVTERKLNGVCPNKEYLNNLSKSALKLYFKNYIETLFNIQKIKTSFLLDNEPLDLAEKFFQHKQYKNWNELLIYNLEVKYLNSKEIFSQKINNIEYIIQNLKESINKIHVDKYSLIHGDFFPANTMIDNKYNTTAILDFGILTTVGDPIFDIALGWIFSDMYGEIKSLNVKEYLKGFVNNKLNKDEQSRVYAYLLLYSIISANMYETNDPSEGHFNWCISNLNNKLYIDRI